jgi:hypothetical protein
MLSVILSLPLPGLSRPAAKCHRQLLLPMLLL